MEFNTSIECRDECVRGKLRSDVFGRLLKVGKAPFALERSLTNHFKPQAPQQRYTTTLHSDFHRSAAHNVAPTTINGRPTAPSRRAIYKTSCPRHGTIREHSFGHTTHLL